MKRSLSDLENNEFDLIVIGGGIFGVCAAWDATLRGLSVAIIERGDFGCATSANSYKIVHGGLRYVQHGDVYRIRQSSNERRALSRIAPHLVHPLPIVVPTYGHGMKGKEVLRIGMGLYDLFTLDRNRNIAAPSRHIPRCRFMSRLEVLNLFPNVNSAGLTGGALFHDGQIYNPTRLILAFLRSAFQAGAVTANYVEATKFIQHKNRVCGVEAKDNLTGATMHIRGKVVLNAAGPYAERLLNSSIDTQLSPKATYSRDACLVVARRLTGDYALAVQAKTSDPDAILSRGPRHLFIAPWRHYTLIGVWHKVYTGDPDKFTVTDEDLQTFLNEINESYPTLELTLNDVALWNAGLVLFGTNDEGKEDLSYGHRSRIIDHAKTHAVEGLITLIGVRVTTGRGDAAEAVNIICNKIGHRALQSNTAITPIHGGDIDNIDDFMRSALKNRPTNISIDVMRSLVRNYGTHCGDVIRLIKQNADLGTTIGNSTTIKAQVAYACREEMAQRLADVVLRRTDLGTGEYPGRCTIESCGQLMATEMGWDKNRTRQEVEKTVECYPSNIRLRHEYTTDT
ncbi:MAG: glycerol-3-phosphate dehydrogenase/oxidase [Pirellulales bacterium]